MAPQPLCESDFRFMQVIWANEPLSSSQLVALCADQLGWKKSTTYTMLRKLCAKGFLQNQDSTVRALVPRDQVQATESKQFVDQRFAGSLPQFLVSFLGGQKINADEAETIKRLIDEYRED